MKLALCQMPVVMGKENNINKASEMVKEASLNGADVVVLPEMFNCPYSNKYFKQYGESGSGKTFQALKALASRHKVILIGGSIPEIDGDRVYNTTFVFDSKGKCIGKHRKAHLFDINVPGGIRFMESETLSPGNKSTLIESQMGTIGLAICYDIRFPDFFRKMALEGAKLIIVPAAFNMTTGPAHWEVTARARALDNQVFLALCSPSRDENGPYVAYGHSMVTDPWGRVLSSLDEKQGILYQDINLDECDEIRKNLPLLKHRRPEIY